MAPNDAVSAVAVGVLSALSERKMAMTAGTTIAIMISSDDRSVRPHVS